MFDFCEDSFLGMASSYKISFGAFYGDPGSRQSSVELWRSELEGGIPQSFLGFVMLSFQSDPGDS